MPSRFQKSSGQWTHEALGTSKAAEAKTKFELWMQTEFKKKFAGLHDVEPVPLKQLAAEHLANVQRYQA
ncbi:MAG TPA: hypothetical protein VGZ73_26290 [Bryobacteraceae bacterium]|jgi:hypothetical protein|nr:hypothetical protein [Bryobacteraceae bacterium]